MKHLLPSFLRAAGALLLLSAAPLLQAQTPAPVFQTTLDNGMTLIVKPDHRAPTAVHMLWVRVGSMDEVDGASGLAHLLEHMMFKGTPSVPAGEFSRQVAALGGRENAFTSKDYTGFFQQIPSQQLEAVMRLESDRFAHNQWSDEDFRKELEVVKEERRLRTEDSPRARLQETLDAVVWQTAPYRRPVVGWMADLESLQPDDARDFYRRWYVPSNAAVVVAGDVDPAQVLQLARRYYGPLVPAPLPQRKPRTEPAQAGMRRLFFKAPADQSYVALVFKTPALQAAALEKASATDPGSEDALALSLLAAVLDGYDNARLGRALTQGDDPVADSTGAHCGLSGRGPQACTLYAVPARGKAPGLAEAALRAEVARIAREGVSPAELERVRNQWLASEVYQQDSVFNQGRMLGSNWAEGLGPQADAQLLARLRAVTPEQVQSVAARYFGDDALTVATLLPQPPVPRRAPTPAVAGLRH